MEKKKYIKNLKEFLEFISPVKTDKKYKPMTYNKPWMKEFDDIEKNVLKNGNKKKY